MYTKKLILVLICSFLTIGGCLVKKSDQNQIEEKIIEKKVVEKKVVEKIKEGWLINYEEVYQKSVKENKPIMVNFTGSDWCGWCKKLKKAVFDTELFKDWANENVILLELDYPRRTPQEPEIKEQNRRLQQTFRQFVRGYPTILIFNISRTYKEDGSKDKDNIELLPSTQLVMQGQGRLGYMSNPQSFIDKAELIINGTKN